MSASVLAQLRDLLIAGKRPIETDDAILINSQAYPKKLTTAWRLKRGDYLELDALIFLLNNEKTKLSDYVGQTKARKIQSVSFSEWRPIFDYFKGTLDTTPYIDRGFEPSPQSSVSQSQFQPQPQSASESKNNDASEEASRKRQKTESIVDLSQSQPQPVSAVSVSVSVSPLEWKLSHLLAEERLVVNRMSCLQGKRPLGSVSELFDQTQKAREQRRAEKSAMDKAAQRESRSAGGRAAVPPSNTPLILVPSSLSSTITLYNVHEFLDSGLLIPTSEKRTANPVKPSRVIVTRPSVHDRSKSVTYECIDDPARLRPSDWNRVVAVFVSGADWQFNDWPFTVVDPVTQQKKVHPPKIFESICPFYLYYDMDELPKNVQQWKVHRLQLSKVKGYNDRSQAMEFWNVLTEFALTKKKHLTV